MYFCQCKININLRNNAIFFMSNNTILVPTNFSRKANIAYRQSINFAERTNGDIYLLNVISQKSSANNLDLEIDFIHNQVLKLIENSDDKLRQRIHTRIEYGRVNTIISKVEKELKPDFMFIGSDAARSDHAHSITLKLIDRISCPLVVFAGRYDKIGCDRIVLPVDLTKETKQKVNLAVKLAQIYNSTIHVVSAISKENLVEQFESRINEVKSIFDKLAIPCQTKILRCENNVEIMANAINDYSDDIDASAIIIMTRQETKLQKFFIGSMATELIKKASVPIVCVSPKEVSNQC